MAIKNLVPSAHADDVRRDSTKMPLAAPPGKVALCGARTAATGVDRRSFVSGILAACLASRESMAVDVAEPQAAKEPAIAALAHRVMGPRAAELAFETIPTENSLDVFEVQYGNGTVTLRGNNTVAQAAALNCFLRECCHSQISWTGSQVQLPRRWSVPGGKIRRNSLFQYRYFLNYCTFSYTMAFWDWPRWQRELDWMALNGINLALAAVIGQECVWQNVMRRMGQAEQEIKQFIAGPAFEPWWLMDNLEGWGGPVWDGWIENRQRLQTRILGRMRSLGIEPVFEGFYGMVPSSLKKHYPKSKIISTGDWCMFPRPPMLLPTDPLFSRMAGIWYEEQYKLFGGAKYFGGDPFHEGSVPVGVNLEAVGRGIESAMQKAKPGAIWVMQGWQNNPHQRVLDGTTKDRTLILDLWGDGPDGGSYRKRDNWSGHPWVWCIINDFGGNISLYGQWDKLASGPFQAINHGRMVGIGAVMEATVDYPNFQLLYDLAWKSEAPSLTKWAASYAVQRYGGRCASAEAAWVLLKDTVYNSKAEGRAKSIFCDTPGADILQSHPWNHARPLLAPYNNGELVLAWRNLLAAAGRFGKTPTYRFDLTDVTRQVLDDLGLWQYSRMVQALKASDHQGFERQSQLFLSMILDQDKLLATQSGFLLGRWIAAARALGNTAGEKTRLERNARTLITVWGPKPGLEDYSAREWAGMLKNFYFQRWHLWIRQQQGVPASREGGKINWFTWAPEWTRQQTTFPNTPSGDSVQEALRIGRRYTPLLKQAGWWL
ncbi:MAG: alpha-N-acetylglucosaminidase [Phycisphaerae bacterium]